MKKFCKSFDEAGHSVTLNYKQKGDSYVTCLGGFLSFLAKLVVAIAVYSYVQDMASGRSGDVITSYMKAAAVEDHIYSVSEMKVLPYLRIRTIEGRGLIGNLTQDIINKLGLMFVKSASL